MRRMAAVWSIAVWVSWLWLGTPVLAQEATPIHYGDTVSGAITTDVPCVSYRFAGSAGDAIAADMRRTSGSLDGVLTLLDASGAVVVTNDDRPSGGLDPLLETRLPTSGRYTLRACRLQQTGARVTTGTFDLTLSGAPAVMQAPPGGNLSDSVFGPAATPTPSGPIPTVSVGVLLAGGASTGPASLSSGSQFRDLLAADVSELSYLLPVQADDRVTIEWTRVEGQAAVALRAAEADGAVLAEAHTRAPVDDLALIFRAPADATLTLSVARQPGTEAPAALAFALDVDVRPGAPAATPAAPASTPPTAAYLAAPCLTQAQAVHGLGSSERLIDVYTAAGDSYYADQLTRTETFSVDDDLNLIFLVQNVRGSVGVAGVFCAPGGGVFDAGESSFTNGGQYLIGLDWEFHGDPWVPGDWYAELYVDGAWELSMAFTVAP